MSGLFDIGKTDRSLSLRKGILRTFLLEKSGVTHVQVVRFVVTGAFTAAIDVALLILLVEQFFLHYLLAGLISFTVAVCLNYLISSSWVFLRGRYRRSVEFMGFFLASAAGLAINQLVLWILVDSLDIDYRLSKLVSVVIVTVWNFTTKKYLVFRRS